MEQLNEVPVHVRCIANYPVSAFFYRYRRDVLGMAEAKTRTDMLADPGLGVFGVLSLFCRFRQCREDRGRHPSGTGIRTDPQARLGRRADHDAAAGRQYSRRVVGVAAGADDLVARAVPGRSGACVARLDDPLLVPESPRFLMRMGRHDEARRSLGPCNATRARSSCRPRRPMRRRRAGANCSAIRAAWRRVA